MVRLSPDAESTKRTTKATPLGACGLKADIADLAIFPMPVAGANITGASIVSDGEAHCHGEAEQVQFEPEPYAAPDLIRGGVS